MNDPTPYEIKRLTSTLLGVIEIANGGSMDSDLAREIRELAERVLKGRVPCDQSI